MKLESLRQELYFFFSDFGKDVKLYFKKLDFECVFFIVRISTTLIVWIYEICLYFIAILFLILKCGNSSANR